ncbi:hypothetical protein IT895_12555 [Halomonas sp. A40-4]|uniref:hypothetical protein n=1 Tax=Halomonas sp. A40-4 TaxID=2785909 RepID=UPI0018EF517C|nr:hypothetical protein [Halomonas sp. A40-4]QPL45024.1 hypothetical protein IT895_12555 [Halomonas sp. A40-4]
MNKITEINSYQRASEVVEIVSPENPIAVNADNFLSLIGDYHLNDSEPPLKCCCEKDKKKLCRQSHRNGYVVELKDGEKSLLGSTCVKDFDPDGDLRKSVSQYDNEKRYQERVSYINHCFRDKDKISEKLRIELERLSDLNHFVSGFLKSIPAKVSRKLQDMSKTGRKDITVDVRVVKEEKDKETGEVERDVNVITHKIGEVSGLEIFQNEYRLSFFSTVKNKIKLIEDLESVKDKEGARAVLRIYKELQEIEPLCERSKAYCSKRVFFEQSSFKNFIFLSDNEEDRVKCYQMWHFDFFEKVISKSNAEKEIAKIDKDLLDQFEATNLIIAA